MALSILSVYSYSDFITDSQVPKASFVGDATEQRWGTVRTYSAEETKAPVQ